MTDALGPPVAQTSLADVTAGSAGEFDFRAIHAEIGALLDKQIFFVGGAVKSGTTWLQVLLDAHPRVSCAGENHFVNSLSPKLKQTLEEHNRVLLDPRGNTAYALGKQPVTFGGAEYRYVATAAALTILLKQARAKPAALAIGDKTTRNVHVFGPLLVSFPGAKCIHIARDPRDGAVSGWHHIRRIFPEESKPLFPTMHDYVKHYADVWASEVGLAAADAARDPAGILEIRYEDLVARPAPTLAQVLRFLGVDHDDAVVERCLGEGSFETLSGGRARGQERLDSFFRKGVVGDWKTRLDAASVAYIVAKCGDLMRRFGYL
jgi:hypothetical protein